MHAISNLDHIFTRQLNESKLNSDSCEEGTLTCDRNFQCDVNAVCEERNKIRKCYCNQGYTGDGLSCTRTAPPTDCYDVFTSDLPDGVYTIQPTGWAESPFQVYCNMSHGGGWTVSLVQLNCMHSFL
ncbi:Fibrinogen C domain-containing protein 1 [Holothuria leucospilota]|uniref:Fibrinogen C domain-containing protein 1 n=1 Tax=Holothuria leucospilota TaxID=206669 RepID=A0A9Q1C051_HOLLE|nr:Fibrinogen C domain-containing protein 1 [Holothuria leucospilota]